MDFDQVFAWEYRTIAPDDYWKLIPLRLVDTLHFYNAAVTAENDGLHNPLRIIKKIAEVDDFVSFKLGEI